MSDDKRVRVGKRGSLKLTEPRMYEDGDGKFTVTEIDGKVAFVFESTPALVFISPDGRGATDRIYIDGVEKTSLQRLTITSDISELTSYTASTLACIAEKPREAE